DEPPTIDPYNILSLSRSATADQIRSAYRRAALLHHPDKAPPESKDLAHVKFQEIAFAYAILSDPSRRARYDATGSTSESVECDSDFNWADFYRHQYEGAVSEATISKFASEYRNSEEERTHLLAAYTRHKGRMAKIYEDVMLSDMVDDEERFREIIDTAIAAEEVQSFPAYANESTRARETRLKNAKRKKAKEEKEAKEEGGGMEDLKKLIQSRHRQSDRNDFLSRLEEKYGGKKRHASPPEEAIQRNRKARK
ncbi:DnaJ-domain-containing protein, partial [Piedraia hortae CBS 480.64]